MPNGKMPPRTPGETELDEAYLLCCAAATRDVLRLSNLQREAIVRLCGRVPESKTEARRWKIALRALRKEVAAELDQEGADE